jgi:hypothetical protein
MDIQKSSSANGFFSGQKQIARIGNKLKKVLNSNFQAKVLL